MAFCLPYSDRDPSKDREHELGMLAIADQVPWLLSGNRVARYLQPNRLTDARKCCRRAV
jgi:hypothetical protein